MGVDFRADYLVGGPDLDSWMEVGRTPPVMHAVTQSNLSTELGTGGTGACVVSFQAASPGRTAVLECCSADLQVQGA